MVALIHALRVYILRDAGYVLGGSLVLLSALWVSGNVEKALGFGVPAQLLFLGYSYVIGFALQEVLTLTPFLTMADYFVPGPITRRLYQWSSGRPWRFEERFDPAQVTAAIYSRATPENQAWLDRIASQRIVFAATGSGAVMAAIVLTIGYLDGHAASMLVAAALLISGIVLLLLSWLKAAHQLEYTHALSNEPMGPPAGK